MQMKDFFFTTDMQQKHVAKQEVPHTQKLVQAVHQNKSICQASVGNLNSCNCDLPASQSERGGGLPYPQDGFKACILFPFVLVHVFCQGVKTVCKAQSGTSRA